MVTKSQQKMFDEIDANKLTPKQKGDFYYRMSLNLKKRLDELETISYLLDKIPESYQKQKKLDLRKAAINAMEITEKLIKRLDPAFISPIIRDQNGEECNYRENRNARRVGSRIIRRFKVNYKSYLPGISKARATIKVSYEPTNEEIDFINRITEHQHKIEKIRYDSETPPRLYVYSTKEFEDKMKELKSRGTNFKYELENIIGEPDD